jgi:hypothetical protein
MRMRHKDFIAMYFICIKYTENSDSLIVEKDTSNTLIWVRVLDNNLYFIRIDTYVLKNPY